jgi:hypothetical protein
LGHRAVQQILELQLEYSSLSSKIDGLERLLQSGHTDQADWTELRLELVDQRLRSERIHESIRRKRSILGVNERADLAKLQGSKYLQHRVNALALKTRIRDRLRQRKFELERLERAYCRSHSTSGKCLSHGWNNNLMVNCRQQTQKACWRPSKAQRA